MSQLAEYAIECTDIRKSFGSVEALRGVSLNAKPGEVTAIVGDNGAGKSTLIKCISGVYTPDSGTIKINGTEVSFSSPEESREFGIETVYQTLSLIEDLTIWQNLYLNREIVRSFGPFKILNKSAMRDESKKMLKNRLVLPRSKVRSDQVKTQQHMAFSLKFTLYPEKIKNFSRQSQMKYMRHTSLKTLWRLYW